MAFDRVSRRYRRIDRRLRNLNSESSRRIDRKEGGIALFMVLTTVAMLAFLVTQFTYVAAVNQKMSYDNLDRVRAHYLAKSGFKLSLLRLKAFQYILKYLEKLSGGGSSGGNNNNSGNNTGGSNNTNGNNNSNNTVKDSTQGTKLAFPRHLVDQIWSFPFVYPLPTSLPGMSGFQKDIIEKFHEESALQGSFVSSITSESSRFNLNSILVQFAVKFPKAQKDQSGKSGKTGNTGRTGPTGDDEGDDGEDGEPNSTGRTGESGASGESGESGDQFDPEKARKSLSDFLFQILTQKFDEDDDFADAYRDFLVEDLVDNIIAWADPSFEVQSSSSNAELKPKRAPFYSMSELHMIPPMEDEIFNLFAPRLTVSMTPGFNVNKIDELTLRALIPDLQDEEVEEFFNFRDDPEAPNHFQTVDEFYKYIKENFSTFASDDENIKKFQDELKEKRIRFIVNEQQFKIEVNAQVNQASRSIAAIVTIEDDGNNNSTGGASNQNGQDGQDDQGQGRRRRTNIGAVITNKQDQKPGIRITSFRIL